MFGKCGQYIIIVDDPPHSKVIEHFVVVFVFLMDLYSVWALILMYNIKEEQSNGRVWTSSASSRGCERLTLIIHLLHTGPDTRFDFGLETAL